MKILIEKSFNGSTIKGDAIMLSKYGEVYNAIDNLYHPNPGFRDEGYPEIERCIDWCYQNNFKAIKKWLDEWIKIRIANILIDDPKIDLEDLEIEVMYSDMYESCLNTKIAIKTAYNTFNNSKILKEYVIKDELDAADKIVSFINEKFTRVRAGGKLNPDGTDSIYFRISSHGFDWHYTFVNFLWEVFGEPKKMPRRIVICHDAENNPPEKILFDGTPEELLEKEDIRVFEELRKKVIYNLDREAERKNQVYRNYLREKKLYISFK